MNKKELQIVQEFKAGESMHLLAQKYLGRTESDYYNVQDIIRRFMKGGNNGIF